MIVFNKEYVLLLDRWLVWLVLSLCICGHIFRGFNEKQRCATVVLLYTCVSHSKHNAVKGKLVPLDLQV